MGLRETIRNATLTAFKAIGNIARPATYKLTGAVTRDLDAGTSVPVTVDIALPRVVFTKFKEEEMDASVNVKTDQKFLIPALDLVDADGDIVEPKASDIIVDENDKVWEIVKRMGIPTDALIILHVRTSKSV